MSSTIYFGKHNGKTLVQIVFDDPAWFVWALEQNIFRQRGERLQAEAVEIWRKARNIKIPREGYEAAYYSDARSGKFMDLMMVPDGLYEEHADVRDVLDLGYVCQSERAAVGNKLLVKAIKRILFGKGARVTPDALERFFADPENFDLPTPKQQAAE